MGPMRATVLDMLRQLARLYVSAPLPEWDEFARSTRFAAFDPRTRIPSGDSDVFVIARGLAKTVRPVGGDARSVVEEFVQAPGVVAPKAVPSWAKRGISAPLVVPKQSWEVVNLELETIERTHVLRIDLRVIEELARRYPEWGQLYNAFMWSYVLGFMHSAQARALGNRRAEARYRQFVAERSSLLKRVTQRDLASYFGVTESGLSRIASRVRVEDQSRVVWEELDWSADAVEPLA